MCFHEEAKTLNRCLHPCYLR